ncbi:MAG: hypothetical protein NT120_04710 [Candidatus Aenigmarchaeota archaeon]|nr:hypothetical protein [Candidatus Aenigmarchaeota archaeon]
MKHFIFPAGEEKSLRNYLERRKWMCDTNTRDRIKDRVKNIEKYIDHIDLAMQYEADEKIVLKLWDMFFNYSPISSDFHEQFDQVKARIKDLRKFWSKMKKHDKMFRSFRQSISSLKLDDKRLSWGEALYLEDFISDRLHNKLSQKRILECFKINKKEIFSDLRKIRYINDNRKVFLAIPGFNFIPYPIIKIVAEAKCKKRSTARIIKKLLNDELVSETKDHRFKLSATGEEFRSRLILK